MTVIGVIVYVIVFALLQVLYNDLQNNQSSYNTTIDRNLTLALLISNSILENWIADPSKITTQKMSPPETTSSLENVSSTLYIRSSTESPTKTFIEEKRDKETLTSPTTELQGDEASVPSPISFDAFVESLFEPPLEEVEPDWSIVLGTFSHYDDENWKEFLIQTEVPMIVRLFLSDSSETATFSRKLKKRNKYTKQEKRVNPKLISPSEYEVTISTSSWILTHESKFHLGEMVIEHDLDGTDSMNTFFFSNPRLLIHNKIKNQWRTAIVRHFDEKGLNMTFVDRDRLVMARRFFKRI